MKTINKGVTFVFLLVSVFAINACVNKDWRTASRESAGISGDPKTVKKAVIEVFAADAFSWRGWFAVHTWLAVKPKDADFYTVYEVVGWNQNNGLPALRQYETKTPDRYWYGAKPERVLFLHGEKAERLIPTVLEAVDRYPYKNEYKLFPGPNSNTFPAWVGKQVPELELDMPLRAIGSGYAH